VIVLGVTTILIKRTRSQWRGSDFWVAGGRKGHRFRGKKISIESKASLAGTAKRRGSRREGECGKKAPPQVEPPKKNNYLRIKGLLKGKEGEEAFIVFRAEKVV